MSVYSNNDYDPLKEVIVGTPFHARIPVADKSTHCIQFMNYDDAAKIPVGEFPQQIIEETEEDIQLLIEAIEKFGAKVLRPEIVDHSKTIETLDWKTDGLYNYCPRDLFLVIGDLLIETPMTMRSRFLEHQAYKHIFVPRVEEGLRWISAPKPRLLDESYQRKNLDQPALNNVEPVFDAANVLRMGKDIFYLVSNTGNLLGARWLQNTLGSDYNVHTMEDVYAFSHIDSTIIGLNEDLVLLNPDRVRLEQLPKELRERNCVFSPPMVEREINGHSYASKWVGMNLLSLSPSLAIVDSAQEPLINLLEKNGVEVIPLQLRHSRVLGGGFHCITLDTVRGS